MYHSFHFFRSFNIHETYYLRPFTAKVVKYLIHRWCRKLFQDHLKFSSFWKNIWRKSLIFSVQKEVIIGHFQALFFDFVFSIQLTITGWLKSKLDSVIFRKIPCTQSCQWLDFNSGMRQPKFIKCFYYHERFST